MCQHEGDWQVHRHAVLLSCLRPASHQSIVSRRSCAERALIKTHTLSGKWPRNSPPAGDTDRPTDDRRTVFDGRGDLSVTAGARSERYWRITTDPSDLGVSLTTQRDVTGVSHTSNRVSRQGILSPLTTSWSSHLRLSHYHHQQQNLLAVEKWARLL